MGRSSILFRMPSFRRGLARTVDVGGAIAHRSYHVSRTPGEADLRAARADWAAVGDDLRSAVSSHRDGPKETDG